MYLSPGFVVGGRYVVDELLSAGSKFRVYSAMSTDPRGPGEVAIKVARHDEVTSAAQLAAGRARVAAEWRALMQLHEHATSAAPLPIELVRMYPGDPDVRRVALMDKSVVRSEPYMVCELADGLPLSTLLQRERLDEERALLISLRVLLLIRAARRVGVELTDFSASNFVVDAAGANVSIVGVTGKTVDVVWAGPTGKVPEGYGRLLAGVLAGVAAPNWGGEEEDLPRWRHLLETRRVPPEFHPLILGSLGYRDAFDATIDAVENRLRGLARAPRSRTFNHPSKSQDAPYLIAPQERIQDRFEVTKPLGQGGRGFVYRVCDERSDAEVLIKCNKYTYDSGSAFALELPTRRAELEHEYEVLKHFASKTGMLPQPVGLVHGRARGSWFDLAPELAEGEPYLAMEFIKGIPLLDLLPKPYEGYAGAQVVGNRLDPRFVLRLMAQIADVLRRFHEDGYLYQDLKPENVLYDPGAENVYMVDFAGACPRVPSGELDKRHVAFGVQTHGFAAPEFAELWERSDERFDIYSLGATAYHLLTGVNPERVALEEGTEYPHLKRSVLDTIPPGVAELVAACLAPVEQRVPSAAEVKRLAERARLMLSRTRPLDVLDLSVSYTTAGTQLRWRLPEDPRIAGVRVTRKVEEDEAVVFDGGQVSEFIDTDAPQVDAAYVVYTAYGRGSARKHSRGWEVRAEARPAPVLFEVAPYFGGNIIRCAVAPHASERVVRWSLESPPLDVTDGEPLELVPGTRQLHALPAGTSAFYAAFALYGDEVSAPRSGSARALGPLPEPGKFTLLNTARGVGLRWEHVVDELRVRVRVAGEEELVLAPQEGASEVWDTSAAPNARVELEPFVLREGVSSEPLEVLRAQRWPAAPALALTPGVEAVLLSLPEPLHPRFSELQVYVQAPGSTPAPQVYPVDSFPQRVAIPSNVEVSIRVVAAVDGGAHGPENHAKIVVPGPGEELRLRQIGDALPARMLGTLPLAALKWSGVFDLRWWRDDRVLEERTGTLPELFRREGARAERRLDDDTLEPGEQATYRLELEAASGERVAMGELGVRGVERLSAPRLTPLLARVRVEPLDEVPSVDLLITLETQEVISAVSLPYEVEVAAGTPVSIAVRRSMTDAPMHWSATTSVTSLQRPDPPRGVRVAPSGEAWSGMWEPSDDAEVDYVVRGFPGNRVVYLGAEPSFVDGQPGATSYTVFSRRQGLLSEPVSVEVERASEGSEERTSTPEAGTLSVPQEEARRGQTRRGRARPPAPLRQASDALVRCITVRGVRCAELAGPARARLVAVVPAGDGSELRALSSSDWIDAARPLAVALVSGRRPLVAWRGRGRVSIFVAPLEPGRPDWSQVALDVAPVAGRLVEARATGESSLHVRPLGGDLPVEKGDALLVYPASGAAEQHAISSDARTLLRELPRGGVELALPAKTRPFALGLEVREPPVVLVPAGGAPSPLAGLWVDAANGFPLWMALALETRWKAPLAARSEGNPAAFHFIKEGEHVEVTFECAVENARGTARLFVRVASSRGVSERTFRARLGAPRSFDKTAEAVAAWLERAVRPDENGGLFRLA